MAMSEKTTYRPSNMVVVGDKPNMNYIVACLTLFNAGESKINVRARGRHISKAVDTVELLRRVFLRNVTIEDVTLGTESLLDKSGKNVGVSTIDIKLNKLVESTK